jgi:hypothetical protein
MRTWTNMTWPDDPYRTGQQLHRRPVPRLAAFTAELAVADGGQAPAAVAVVYLPLHRTRTVTVTERTLMFGFRAASTADPAEAAELAGIADLDLMQARRHAQVLAGYHLADQLAALLSAAPGRRTLRGLAAVQHDWADRASAAGQAAMFDCAFDLPASTSLEQPRGPARLEARSAFGSGGPGTSPPVVTAVERALAIALVCARHLGRYGWAETLDTGQVMAAAAWDCLPWPGPATCMASLPHAAAAGHGAEPAAARGSQW